MAQSEALPHNSHFYLAISAFGVLSVVAGVLQLVQQIGSPEAIAVSLFFFISLTAFTALVILPPCYSSFCFRISFFFTILTAASLLSQFLPNNLKWVPYFSCLLPLFNLLPTKIQLPIQHLCSSALNTGSVAVDRAHGAISKLSQALHHGSSATPTNIPGQSISSSLAAQSLEEGNPESSSSSLLPQ